MNSRCGLLLLSFCIVGLAGCANWQNRAQQNMAPSLANQTPPPAPGTSFGAPPPPTLAPLSSDPSLTLPPAQTNTGQLNLAAVSEPAAATAPPAARETSREAVPSKLYNLEKSGSSARKVASATPAKEKSSTISKLAKKADSSDSSAKPASKTETSSAPKPSALERLAREAATDSSSSGGSELPRPASAETAAPAPAPAASSPEPAEPEALDTTLLAQPVRKGADAGSTAAPEKESKGPQSNVLPNSKLFNGQSKPAIYPVSNPVVEEQIDITQFS